jgi:hypothetical protein
MTTIRRGIPATLPARDPVRDNARKLARTLEGREDFSGVLVGGQDVKPFLDKTDGAKLVDAGGLASGYVGATTLATTAIRPGAPVTNAALVNVNGLITVGGDVNTAGASEIVSATFTVPETGAVIVCFSVAFVVTNAETCELALFIDYSGITSMQAIRDVETADPTRYREIVQNDPGGDSASVQIVTTQTLTAGSHTIKVLAWATQNASEFQVPAGSAAIEVFVR